MASAFLPSPNARALASKEVHISLSILFETSKQARRMMISWSSYKKIYWGIDLTDIVFDAIVISRKESLAKKLPRYVCDGRESSAENIAG
jgi:hypothetical protein